MNLPNPGPAYSQTDEAQTRRKIESADKQNLKAGNVFDSILMRDKDTGEIVTLTVETGVLVIT